MTVEKGTQYLTYLLVLIKVAVGFILKNAFWLNISVNVNVKIISYINIVCKCVCDKYSLREG